MSTRLIPTLITLALFVCPTSAVADLLKIKRFVTTGYGNHIDDFNEGWGIFLEAWNDAGRDPDQLFLDSGWVILPPTGLDGVSINTAVATATGHPSIVVQRGQDNFDIAVVMVDANEFNACGAVVPGGGFQSGVSSGGLPSTLDTQHSDSHYVVVINHKCTFHEQIALAHEMIHLFGGTHAQIDPSDPGVLSGNRANAFIKQWGGSCQYFCLTLGTLGTSDTDSNGIPFGREHFYSSITNLYYGDYNHDNVSALHLTADSVAAYRVPPPPPGLTKPENVRGFLFRTCDSYNFTEYRIDWDVGQGTTVPVQDITFWIHAAQPPGSGFLPRWPVQGVTFTYASVYGEPADIKVSACASGACTDLSDTFYRLYWQCAW